MTLNSTQKVVAIATGLLLLAGTLFANTWTLAQYAQQSAAFDSTTARRLASLQSRGDTNRKMILKLGKANRYDIGDPRRSKALDELEQLDEQDRFK